MLPADALEPLAEHLEEPGIGVDDGDPEPVCPLKNLVHLRRSVLDRRRQWRIVRIRNNSLVHKLFAGYFASVQRATGCDESLNSRKQTGHDERGLLADVDRVVADPLQRPRHERHVHRPLARVDVVADLDGRSGTARG